MKNSEQEVRRSYYIIIAEQERKRIEELENRLNQNDEYRQVENQIRIITPKFIRVFNEYKKLNEKLDSILKDMNISISDLFMHIQCSKCNDTGFLPDGQLCDCYLKQNNKGEL